MKMEGRTLLSVVALLFTTVHAATNTCDVLKPGSFTRVFAGTPPSGWIREDFNDAKWKVQSFPFASCPTCVGGRKSSSFFDPNNQLITRTVVELKNRVWGGELKVRVGNKAWVYVNGRHVGDVHNPKECQGDAGFPWKSVNIPEFVLREGSNTIVVKALGQSSQAYVDIDLKVRQAADCDDTAVLQCAVIGQDTPTRTLTHGFRASPPAGAFEVNFDDSSLRRQTFPLGEFTRSCRRTACLDIQGWLPTNNNKTLTRTRFYLNRVPQYDAQLKVSAVDAWVRVNGVKLGDLHANDCKWMELGKFFVVPKNILRVGYNVLTVTVAGTVERSVNLALPELNILDTRCPVVADQFCEEACADLSEAGFCSNNFIENKCAATCI